MTTTDELRARVAQRYDELALPSWPPPRDPMASPEPQEYSRVSDRGKYLITHARGRVWTEVLAELPGVSLEERPVSAAERVRGRAPGRTLVVTQADGATLPLVLDEVDGCGTGADALVPVLHIGVAGEGEPTVVATQPDCGCDACDDGSAAYLQAIDDVVVRILSEPLVLLRGYGWHADWSPSGWSCGGAGRWGDPEHVIAQCRRIAAGEHVDLPEGTQVAHSRPWHL